MYITECDFYVELLLWAVLYFMFMLFYFDENARESSWKFRHLGVIYRGERSCCSGKFTRVLVFTVESKKRRVLSCLTPASSLTSSFCGVTVLWTLKAWTFLWKTLLVVFYFISSVSLFFPLTLFLRLLFLLIFLFLFFISVPLFSYFHFLSAFPSACLFWFTPTPTPTCIFYLIFLSPFLLSFASYHFRPFILISILFSFLCDSYFYSFSPSRSCFSLSLLYLFLL